MIWVNPMTMKYNTTTSTSIQPLLYFYNEKQQMFDTPYGEDYRCHCILYQKWVTLYLYPGASLMEVVFR